jgi:two-component system, NarL family, nitrate/nitrite response regulator NarL
MSSEVMVPLQERRRQRPVRIAIVDDHALVAESVAIALRGDGIEVSCVNGAAEDLVAEVARLGPDLVLLDLILDDAGRTGLELIAPIRAVGAQVLMMTGVGDRHRHAECVAAGAVGVVNKAESLERIAATVTAVLDGRPPLSVAERQRLLAELDQWRRGAGAAAARLATLTGREAAVLGALVSGCTAARIAERDYVALSTVRAQIRSILHKLGVHSQIEAVALAVRAGWT